MERWRFGMEVFYLDKNSIVQSWNSPCCSHLSLTISDGNRNNNLILSEVKRLLCLMDKCQHKVSIMLNIVGNLVTSYSPGQVNIFTFDMGQTEKGVYNYLKDIPHFENINESCEYLSTFLSQVEQYTVNEDKISFVILTGVAEASREGKLIVEEFLKRQKDSSKIYVLFDGEFYTKVCDGICMLFAERSDVEIRFRFNSDAAERGYDRIALSVPMWRWEQLVKLVCEVYNGWHK